MRIIWNDILRERADVLVTPASRNPQIGTGLDRIIHRAAGPQLLAERRKLGRIEPGKVGVTKAFGVARTTGAKWIIHALGPVWNGRSGRKEELILDGCYLRILCKAAELGCASIALPVLSSGKFGMPMGKAVDIAVNAIGDFSAAFPKMDVRLVGIDTDFYEYARKRYPELTTARIDAKAGKAYRRMAGAREDDADSLDDAFTMGDESGYFDGQLLEDLSGDGTFKDMFRRLWDYTRKREKAAKAVRRRKHLAVAPGEFICGRMDLAKAAGIEERVIRHYCAEGDETSRTSRDKVIALCVALKLPPPYARRFLATCRYRLEPSGRDRIIADCIASRLGNVAELNCRLSGKGFRILGGRN